MLRLVLEPNVASSFSGASIDSVSSASDSNPAKLAIDDTEASVYTTQPEEDGFTGSEFVVNLADVKPVKVSEIQVSAFKDVSKARFSILKEFSIFTSVDGLDWNEVVSINL
jgi:extracellular elastinolytic metalloproteinase